MVKISITERQISGGNFDFEVTDEDRKRQENDDTESTLEFKKSLREWYNRPKGISAIFKRRPIVEKQGNGAIHRIDGKVINSRGVDITPWIITAIVIIILIWLLNRIL